MKTYFLPTIALFLCSAAGAGNDDLKSLRADVARIERELPALTARSHDIMGQSAEGGEARGWFRGKTLVKIGSTFGGESGRASRTYWLRNGNPITLLVRRENYDKPLSGRVKSRDDEQFYFGRARVVGHFHNSKSAPLSAKANSQALRHAREEIAQLRRMIER